MGTVTLKRVAPIFGVRDVDAALAYYETLGFRTRSYDDGIYGLAARDGIQFHLGSLPLGHEWTRTTAYLLRRRCRCPRRRVASRGRRSARSRGHRVGTARRCTRRSRRQRHPVRVSPGVSEWLAPLVRASFSPVRPA